MIRFLGCVAALPLLVVTPRSVEAQDSLAIGSTFTIPSRVLGEVRRINVYRPPVADSVRLPVLYMPDGGLAEDFLHVAGLVQVLTGNGTMRPFLLVGIENTQRRRDLTGLTAVESDRRIAPRVGGSAEFRAFIRDELMPEVRKRFAVTDERAIVGESLAGLFVVETFMLEPNLFDTYIAFDPSLWWNGAALVNDAERTLARRQAPRKVMYLATSSQKDIALQTTRLGRVLARHPSTVRATHVRMPAETHATIYHPAALKAFRALFGP